MVADSLGLVRQGGRETREAPSCDQSHSKDDQAADPDWTAHGGTAYHERGHSTYYALLESCSDRVEALNRDCMSPSLVEFSKAF